MASLNFHEKTRNAYEKAFDDRYFNDLPEALKIRLYFATAKARRNKKSQVVAIFAEIDNS